LAAEARPPGTRQQPQGPAALPTRLAWPAPEPEEGHRMDLTYSSYLKLEQLLALQEPRSAPAEHDELLFIISHQVYELWFKLQLHELDRIKREFGANQLWEAVAAWKRVRTIMKVMVEQVDILETLTPMSFGSFRDRLEKASGFQSSQFREFEFVLGYKRPDMLTYQQPGTPAYERLVQRLHEPSVVDCFYDFLEQRGVTIPAAVRQRPITAPTEANEVVEDGILHLYKTHPDLEILFELMTDFDEGFQEWRYRHIKLVERTIGSKRGTGGSLGVEFLKKSLFLPVFPDLWAIRHKL
jgi:tryptophan 2,3-dioxygenase